jgi:anti-sigma B factor antagonist
MSVRGRSLPDAPTCARAVRFYVALRRPGQLEINPAPLGDVPGLALAGEVDIAVAKQVEAALDDGIRESTGAFVLDLCDLEFLDSSGVSLILRARALLGREERELVIVCAPGPVHRLFEMTGVLELLALFPSREAAAAALVPADRS